jgi:aminoglycoside phosphotransferase (APT) family kinase protein
MAEKASSEFAAVLAARLVPGGRVGAVRRLTGGVSADVQALDVVAADGQGRSLVVRRHRAVAGKSPPAGAARIEFELLRWIHRAGLPVPEPLLVDDSGSLVAEPFVVMSFVAGTTEISASGVDRAIDIMAATLARLHGLPTDGLPRLPARIDPVPELVTFLPEGAEWSDLRAWLEQVQSSAFDGSPSLLHGDFWPGNLLWRDGELVAILDWEDAGIGDPLSDVACSRLELGYKLGTAGTERFTAAYGRARPVDAGRLALWDVYVAAAALKYMGDWGLEAALEAHMRSTAQSVMIAAAERVLAG